MIAGGAGWDDVTCTVLSATGFWADVVNSKLGEAVVVDRRTPAVCAAIVPCLLDAVPPLLTGFSASQGSHIPEVVGDPLV